MTPEEWQSLSDRLNDALESEDPFEFARENPELLRLLSNVERSKDWLLPKPHDPFVGRVIAGRYQLLHVLGRGGAGVVYLASDLKIPSRRLALKLLHEFWGSQEWMRSKFRAEATLLAKLDHPGIISLIDAGETDDGRLYLVMPYRAGRTLREALSHPIDTLNGARWIRQAGEALHYAHQQGVLHRDLKPENILLVNRDGIESVMLLDFGIAHAGNPVAPPRTTSYLMGSAFYMAPEHLLGRPEPASDLYSLATIY